MKQMSYAYLKEYQIENDSYGNANNSYDEIPEAVQTINPKNTNNGKS
ncbi:MAG: hypothetical protein ACK5KP_06450 [Paludibacteraceae bacterium]